MAERQLIGLKNALVVWTTMCDQVERGFKFRKRDRNICPENTTHAAENST